jgi:hypothetical protein
MTPDPTERKPKGPESPFDDIDIELIAREDRERESREAAAEADALGEE